MAYGRRWKPSKTAKREFAKQMDEVREFCNKKGIDYSSSMDSFYFKLNGKAYRVSNHSIEASNRGAYDELGNQIREKYHDSSRDSDTIYIHASKTRIIDIYTDLENGYELDGRGYRK